MLPFGKNWKVILIDFLQNRPEALETLKPGLSEGMVSINSKMNSFFGELSAFFGDSVLHVQLPEQFFSSSDFVDNCHLNEFGEEKKSEVIFKSILEFVSG